MLQITLNIDDPQIEATLSNLSRQKSIPVNSIVSEMLEKYLYFVMQTNSENNSLKSEFDSLTDEDEIFDDDIDENLFLEDFDLTVDELRRKVKIEEQGEKMTKEEFFKSFREWRAAKEKL